MKVSRAYLEQLFHENKVALQEIAKLKGDDIIVKFYDVNKHKTAEQLRTLYALLQEFYLINGAPYDYIKNFDQFKTYYKACIFNLFEEKEVFKNFQFQKEQHLKSIADYTTKEMSNAIKLLLADIDNSGCNSAKLQKIRNNLDQFN